MPAKLAQKETKATDEAKADEAKADEAKADEAKADEAKADEAKAVSYKPGYYQATKYPMHNGDTGQTFTVESPNKVNAEQLKSGWMQLQLQVGTITPTQE